jgi:hypothetical protein
MRVSDRKFVERYSAWGSQVNWYSALVFMAALKKSTDLEVKKAMFVKIFFEYVQACEHLLVLVDALKKTGSLAGLKRCIVKCPSGGDSFRYLWTDLRRKHPQAFYAYLGIPLSDRRYHANQAALDGFFNAVLACLRNRYSRVRAGRSSRITKAFNKVKHGFPVYTDAGSDTIYFLVSSGRRIRKISFRLDPASAQKLYESTEAIRNSIQNFTALVLAKK